MKLTEVATRAQLPVAMVEHAALALRLALDGEIAAESIPRMAGLLAVHYGQAESALAALRALGPSGAPPDPTLDQRMSTPWDAAALIVAGLDPYEGKVTTRYGVPLDEVLGALRAPKPVGHEVWVVLVQQHAFVLERHPTKVSAGLLLQASPPAYGLAYWCKFDAQKPTSWQIFAPLRDKWLRPSAAAMTALADALGALLDPAASAEQRQTLWTTTLPFNPGDPLLRPEQVAFQANRITFDTKAAHEAALRGLEVMIASGPLSPDAFLYGIDDTDQGSFKRRVARKELRLAIEARKYTGFLPGIRDDEMSEVEDGVMLRKDAAVQMKRLLAAARAALAREKPEGVEWIGLNSGFRTLDQEVRNWNATFESSLVTTLQERKAARGGPEGDAAAEILALRMFKFKALPGYSNHMRGLAVDFATKDHGNRLGPSSSQEAAWRASWFHHWLSDNANANAKRFGFHPLGTEAWHWDYGGDPEP